MKTVNKKLKDIPIHYFITDNIADESILFVHAAFADHTSFDKQVEYFSDKYKVIAIDLIGHGKSLGIKKNNSIHNTAAYIKQILADENIEKVHLVGVSLGALLVQDFANKYSYNVSSLCCIGGYDINNFDITMQKENSGGQMKMMLKAIFSIKWFAEDNKRISAITPEAQDAFFQMNIKFKKSSFRYLATLSKLINKCKTQERQYPLLIGCGDRDIPMELKAARMWHESEPKSNLVIFKNSGHLANMDAPQEFNRVLDDFIFHI